jgi:hypothetical protein
MVKIPVLTFCGVGAGLGLFESIFSLVSFERSIAWSRTPEASQSSSNDPALLGPGLSLGVGSMPRSRSRLS